MLFSYFHSIWQTQYTQEEKLSTLIRFFQGSEGRSWLQSRLTELLAGNLLTTEADKVLREAPACSGDGIAFMPGERGIRSVLTLAVNY